MRIQMEKFLIKKSQKLIIMMPKLNLSTKSLILLDTAGDLSQKEYFLKLIKFSLWMMHDNLKMKNLYVNYCFLANQSFFLMKNITLKGYKNMLVWLIQQTSAPLNPVLWY